jgi:nitrate reductase gamma subunit
MDEFLFIGIPYLAVAVAVFGSIVRYRTDQFSVSTHSSQFLENRALFWGSNAWHYAILLILAAHLAPLIAPGFWSSLLGEPTRLYVLEVTGIALTFVAGFGLVVLFLRRLMNQKVFRVTSAGDWLLLGVLLFQVGFGAYIAIAYRWGGAWYPDAVVPWLRSLITLHPEIATISAMPWPVQVFAYLWRPYQLVLWNRKASRS